MAILAAIVGGAVYGLRQVYFLGTDSGGRAALYRGLPYDLPLGIELYSEVYAAPVQVSAIPASRRDSATDHTLRSHDDAADLLADLQQAAEPPVRKRQGGGRAAEGRPGREAAGRAERGAPAERRLGRRRRAVSARNRELFALLPVAVLVTGGFTAVFIVESSRIGDLSLIYGGYFLAVCLGVHLFIRARLPYADPYLFPLCALLAAIGLVMLFRIDDEPGPEAGVDLRRAARRLLAVTILLVRDYHVLERYRYLIATVGILLLMAPRLPGIGDQVNGAYLGHRPRAALVPAGRGGEDLRGHLPGQLPAREAGAAHDHRPPGRRADDPAAEALRAPAGGLGRVDADARLHPRPGQLADVLRRLPGPALRRHGAALLRGRRLGPVLRRAPG